MRATRVAANNKTVGLGYMHIFAGYAPYMCSVHQLNEQLSV